MLEWTILTMPGLWICMIILHVWQALRIREVLNKPRFWIWYGCKSKGYAEFRICLIMAPYALTIPEHASICFNAPSLCQNMAEYYWISLNMPEHVRINCSDYCSVLNMPQYTYNDIIIVINAVKLEFLSVRFVHSGFCCHFFHFLHELERKNNKS